MGDESANICPHYHGSWRRHSVLDSIIQRAHRTLPDFALFPIELISRASLLAKSSITSSSSFIFFRSFFDPVRWRPVPEITGAHLIVLLQPRCTICSAPHPTLSAALTTTPRLVYEPYRCGDDCGLIQGQSTTTYNVRWSAARFSNDSRTSFKSILTHKSSVVLRQCE